MKLWTIQHENAYEALKKNGVLTANEDYLFCEDEFRFSYDWIAEQMTMRISAPPNGIYYPVWACHSQNIASAKLATKIGFQKISECSIINI